MSWIHSIQVQEICQKVTGEMNKFISSDKISVYN